MSSTSKNIALMKWYWFFTSLRFFAAIQIIYFVKVSGSYTLGMSIFAVSSISQTLFEIPTGIFSDKIGRKKTTMLAALSAIASVGFYAVGSGYWLLFLGAVIEGLGRSFGSGNDQALMYDSLKDENKQEELYIHLGKVNTYTSIGFGITALLGGYIATFSFPLALWLSVLTQIVAFVCTCFLTNPLSYTRSSLHPFAHLKESIIAFKSNPQLRLLTLSRVVKEAIGESAYQFTPAFVATLWPLWAIGILNAAQKFISAFGYFISHKIIKRFEELRTILGTFIFRRITDGLAFAYPTLLSPLLLCLNAIFYGAGQVAEDSLLHKEYTDQQRATMGSLDSLLMSAGFAFVSLGTGYIADTIGIAHTLLGAQFLLLPVLFLYWKMFRHKKASMNP